MSETFKKSQISEFFDVSAGCEVRTSSLWAHTARLPSAESLFTKSYVINIIAIFASFDIFYGWQSLSFVDPLGYRQYIGHFFQNQVLKRLAHFYGESWIRPWSRSIHSLPLLLPAKEILGGLSLVPCPFQRVGYKEGGGVGYLVGLDLTHPLPNYKSAWYASHWKAFLL